MSKTALPTSWRAFDDANVANDYECVVIPQSSSRRRYYEVLTYGVHFGNYQRLDDAKAAIEEIYGPVNWTRVRLPLVEVEHYYFGPTTEFTDPLLVYAADLPRLGATAAATTTVYRGVYLQIEDYDDLPGSLVQQVQQGGIDHTYGTRSDNLGVHWTTDKRVAVRFATPMTRHGETPTLGTNGWDVFVPTIITAEVSSADVVTDEEELREAMVEGHGWNGLPSDTRLPEQEVLVRPGAPMRVSDIEVLTPPSWDEVATAAENLDAAKVLEMPATWQRVGGGMTAVATLGSRLWWRVHPAHREFLPETATSVPFFPAPGQEQPLPGFSCTESPWHLWVYVREQFGYGMWSHPTTDVVGFTGQQVGTGADGEPLVMPDMGVVTRYSAADFLAELVRTPFPPTPRGPFTWLSHYATWEAVAEQLEWMDTGDPVEDHIIASFGSRQAAASKTAGAAGDLPPAIAHEVSLVEGRYIAAAHEHPGSWEEIGLLEWSAHDGKIVSVWVHEDFRRRGVATYLLQKAREVDPRVHHSNSLSDDGKAWSEKTAGANRVAGQYDREWAWQDSLGDQHPLNRQWSMASRLQPFASRVVKGEGWPCEVVLTSIGLNSGSASRVDYDHDTQTATVTLIPEHFNKWSVLHELAHLSFLVQGSDEVAVYHGPRFESEFLRLLGKYGEVGPSRLGSKTAAGNLPEGVAFEYTPDRGTEGRGVIGPGAMIEAKIDGKVIGGLAWFTSFVPGPMGHQRGQIEGVFVEDPYRRRGIATEMWRRAKEIEPRLHHSHALTDEGRAWAEKTSKTAAYDDTLIARGLRFTVDNASLAKKFEDGSVTANDIVRALMTVGGVGVWWGIMGVFGDIEDFEDYAWGEESESLRTALEEYRSEEYGYRGFIGGEVQLVLVAKRPTRNGEPWDPEWHNPPEAGGLMGNSFLERGEQIELVEVRYDAGWGWKSLPAQGIRTTAQQQPEVYYHVSGQSNRASIEQHGLRGGDHGVWLYSDPEKVRGIGKVWTPGHPFEGQDVWQVEATEVVHGTEARDKTSAEEWHPDDPIWVVYEDIPPSRVTRVDNHTLRALGKTASQPDVYYHVTSYENWPDIRDNGLRPGGDGHVWLFTNAERAMLFKDAWDSSGWATGIPPTEWRVPPCIVVVRTDRAVPTEAGIVGAYWVEGPITKGEVYDVIRPEDLHHYAATTGASA